MTQEEFEVVVTNTLMKLRETLIKKGREYVRNDNPLHNFETGARIKNISREEVLDGFLLKHEISINDMTMDLREGKLPTMEAVEEKFGDNLAYLMIKKACFVDRINTVEKRYKKEHPIKDASQVQLENLINEK